MRGIDVILPGPELPLPIRKCTHCEGWLFQELEVDTRDKILKCLNCARVMAVWSTRWNGWKEMYPGCLMPHEEISKFFDKTL